MPSTLSAADKATFDLLYLHPVSHNLEWSSVLTLFGQLGETNQGSSGAVKFSRNGKTLSLHPHGKDVGVEDLMNIRHFLKSTDAHAESNPIHENDVLVLLDHSGARIFSLNGDATEPQHVVPLDPLGHDKQVHNPKGDSGGQQGPLRHLFYESLVKHLAAAGRILFLGDARGASSEIDHFFVELELHHHEISSRIVFAEAVDTGHMTYRQLLAHARKVFTNLNEK